MAPKKHKKVNHVYFLYFVVIAKSHSMQIMIKGKQCTNNLTYIIQMIRLKTNWQWWQKKNQKKKNKPTKREKHLQNTKYTKYKTKDRTSLTCLKTGVHVHVNVRWSEKCKQMLEEDEQLPNLHCFRQKLHILVYE